MQYEFGRNPGCGPRVVIALAAQGDRLRFREFGRPVLDTGTIRKMDRCELEEQLRAISAEWDETARDDELRDALVMLLEDAGAADDA